MTEKTTTNRFGSIEWKHPFVVHGKRSSSENKKDTPKRRLSAKVEESLTKKDKKIINKF